MGTPRTSSQQALLHVAGASLADGQFLDETAWLLDATDRRCAEQMRQLRDGGHRAAISAVVRATYSGFYYTDERELQKLPASVVINACEHSRIMRQRPVLKPSPAHAIWDGPTLAPPRWGRLTATLLLLNRDDPDDHKLLPDVFTAAWTANGSHLRLTALTKKIGSPARRTSGIIAGATSMAYEDPSWPHPTLRPSYRVSGLSACPFSRECDHPPG